MTNLKKNTFLLTLSESSCTLLDLLPKGQKTRFINDAIISFSKKKDIFKMYNYNKLDKNKPISIITLKPKEEEMKERKKPSIIKPKEEDKNQINDDVIVDGDGY